MIRVYATWSSSRQAGFVLGRSSTRHAAINDLSDRTIRFQIVAREVVCGAGLIVALRLGYDLSLLLLYTVTGCTDGSTALLHQEYEMEDSQQPIVNNSLSAETDR